MDLMTVAAIISPFVSGAIAMIGGIYWWGKQGGIAESKLKDHEERITEQERMLREKNGRPSYITRNEFNQDWKPYIKQLKDSVDTINTRMERIEVHLGIKSGA